MREIHTTMQRDRIAEGFHRAGIVTGAVVFVLGLAMASIISLNSASPHSLWPYIFLAIIPAIIAYCLCRAAGWIIGGFAGSGSAAAGR